MCGIAGGVFRHGQINKDLFEKMVDIISYRGPDDRGVWYDGNIALGHRRLSIIDLSNSGHQPFVYGKYVLVYNGEVYNYRELRMELERDGYSFSTQTDTEIVAASYLKWGGECVNKFNGMWSFAIFDTEKNVLFCSRDRFGVKPFYYYFDSDCLYFGSEIKQILLVLKEGNLKQDLKANRERLMEFMIGGQQDYSFDTMFQDVKQLPPGYNLTLSKASGWHLKFDQWYDLGKTIRSKNSYNEAVKDFRDSFIESVNLRLRSDVPIGFCLSGGLDSSAIVCTADRLLEEQGSPSTLHSISSCFKGDEYAAYDEQEYIDEVVKKTGIIQHKVYPEFKDLFPKMDDIIWHMDEPFSSTSVFAQDTVFEGAENNGLTVMLDGQGSDEQLAGYSEFYSLLMQQLLRQRKFGTLHHEYSAYKSLRSGSEIDANRVLLLTIRNTVLPRWTKNFAYRHFFKRSGIDTPFRTDEFLKYKDKFKFSDFPEQYILDQFKYELIGLLQYEDRNSMAHSIESRVPFLDYRLVEKIFSFPLEYKIHDGKTKVLMRDALKDILPEKIGKRYSKLGFVTPEDKWIRDNKQLFKEEFEKAVGRLSPLIDSNLANQWFNGGKAFNRGNYTMWRIICAGHWADVYNVTI